MDVEGNPFSFLKKVEFSGVVSKICDPNSGSLSCIFPKSSDVQLNVQLYFQGHYGEPSVSLPLELKEEGNFSFCYDNAISL